MGVMNRELLASWLWMNKKVCFTSGAFDILHAQHVKYLQAAKKMGDYLIVGVNSDKSVRATKGPKRPIIPDYQRAEIVAALECVDYVFIFDETNNNKNIELLRPDFYIKGGDYKPEKMTSTKIVEELGGEAVVIPPDNLKISTTNIINTILERYKDEQKTD